MQDLAENLFRANTIYETWLNADSIWKYFFIVEHSQQSQFEALRDLVREKQEFENGILCLARSGDHFKGYRNRTWVAVPGNIHLSVLLKPNQPIAHFHTGFTILAANSAIQALDLFFENLNNEYLRDF